MSETYRWNDKIKIKTKDGQYLTEKEIEYLEELKEEFQKDSKKKVKVINYVKNKTRN